VKSASGRIVFGTAGWIFRNYTTPFCTKSDDAVQLTVGISRDNLPMKPVSVLWRQLQPSIRFPARPLPAARRLMFALYNFDVRDAVATCCVET